MSVGPNFTVTPEEVRQAVEGAAAGARVNALWPTEGEGSTGFTVAKFAIVDEVANAVTADRV